MFSNGQRYDMNSNENFECFEVSNSFDKASIRLDGDEQQRAAMPTKPLLIRSAVEVFTQYCANTSIHGMQYFGAKRPPREKLFWLIVFIISIYCCAVLINSVYIKWHETPVIVSFAEKSTPVWSIPFPAVTICSETKRILKHDGPTYGQLYTLLRHQSSEKQPVFHATNVSDAELAEFRTLLHICNTHIIDSDLPHIRGDELDYLGILQSMAPSFERYFFFCRWLSRFDECEKFFRRTYTEEGICYTFNGLNPTDIYRETSFQYQHWISSNSVKDENLKWTLESGYDATSGISTYPQRVLSAGSRGGLFIALQSFKQETDYACRGPVQGFKMLLHSPDDVPLVSKQFVRIPTGKEILVAVKPNMITTSAGIAAYDAQHRQCFLNSERALRFFKIYTQNNCELECLANFTLMKCGCVKFSMPRTPDTPVCGEDKIYCYDRAEDDLLLREFQQGVKQQTAFEALENTDADDDGEIDCNCMPACTSLVYNTEISQGNFDLKEMLAAESDTDFELEYPGSQMSRLSIYFKENQFITSRRSELYGVTDFLANCGGIFGLFLGFSVLSLVEIFYYITLRWCDLFRYLRRNPN